jgi:hypothetical protein
MNFRITFFFHKEKISREINITVDAIPPPGLSAKKKESI